MANNPKLYPYKNQMLTIGQLSEISGIRYNTLYKRINIMKMSVEDAVKKVSTSIPRANHPWRQYGRR